MKYLITTIAAVVLVGCGPPKAPDISIHKAVIDGNIKAVKQHIAAGTDVNMKNDVGLTPLHFAAGEGHKEVAELLITNGADVNVKQKDGSVPLHLAVSKEISELLIAKGADVNVKNNWGATPLLAAVVKGHKEIVQLLISKDTDVNAKVSLGVKQGLTALDAANETNHPEISDLLRKHGGKTGKKLKADIEDISIHKFAFDGNIAVVKQLLADGVNVNAKEEDGGTALHWAAQEGHKEIVELLISSGADVNVSGPFGGGTALHFR